MEEKKETIIEEKDPAMLRSADPSQQESKKPSDLSVDTVITVVEAGTDTGTDTGTDDPSKEAAPAEEIAPRFSVYKPWQKRLIVLSAAFSALFASWTAQIYLPALNVAAADLDVSITRINLTVTSYMILQGITPIFIGGFADSSGRRPAYLVCFVLYIIANVGLAKSDSYGSLLGLRCFQSATISATQALCQGVVADIATSAERGQYTALIAVPTTLGPSLGPVIGGAIAQFRGWRDIFWFLAICAGVNLAILILVFPETCRAIVGDGSVLPNRNNQTVLQLVKGCRQKKRDAADAEMNEPPPSPVEEKPKANFAWRKFLTSIILLCEKELFLLFLYGGFVYASVYAVGTAIPTLFSEIYGFEGLRIGLIYLPMAVGSILSVAIVGKSLNWNFQRHARKLGLQVDRSVQMDLIDFPIEQARIEVAMPPLILSAVSITAWGWAVENAASVGVMCVLVFVLGLGLVSTSSVLNALVADVRPGKTSAASAANNIIKFGLGAAMAALINPLTQAVGPGKAYSIIAVMYVLLLPCLYLLLRNGMRWRRELREKEGPDAA